MILSEFAGRNGDLLVHRITAEGLPYVTECQVLMAVMLSCSRVEKAKPMEDRKVLDVRHIMLVHNSGNAIRCIRETDSGARPFYLDANSLEGRNAYVALFQTVPFDHKDMRRRTPWTEWAAPEEEE